MRYYNTSLMLFLFIAFFIALIGHVVPPHTIATPIVQERTPKTNPNIALKRATFDPLAGEPVLPTQLQATIQSNQTQTYLIQFNGPIQPQWKDAVAQASAHLYGYIPDYTFIARMDGTIAQRVQSLDMVRWIGLYHPAYRLAADLVASDGTATIQSYEEQRLLIQTLPDVSLDTICDTIVAFGGRVEETSHSAFAGFIQAILPTDQVIPLAQHDGILWIEPLLPVKVKNDISSGNILQANTLRTATGLYGNGQIIAIADTGLDVGTQTSLHPDINGRIQQTYCLGRPSPCDWSDPTGHGTHIVGSALGNGSASGSNPDDHRYENSYAGVAPEAKLVLQSLNDQHGNLEGIPSDRGDLMRQAYEDGARIHTNAWGGPTGTNDDGSSSYGAYVLSSAMVDFAAWQNKDMLILFTAGNSGVDAEKDGQGRRVGNGVIDADSMEQPGTAKNILTVGATENERGAIATTWQALWYLEFPADPIANDIIANNRQGMAAFSSRGATDDGRIKPEIVAPGTNIVSLRTRKYIFDDTLEAENTAGRYTTDDIYGGTGNWELTTESAKSGSHAWRQTVNNAWSSIAATILFTPQMYVSSAGASQLSFWYTCKLNASQKLAIAIRGVSVSDPYKIVTTSLMPLSTFTSTPPSCSSDFQFVSLLPILNDEFDYRFGIDPTQPVQFGFSIVGQTTVYDPDSTWTIDDLRVDGYKQMLLSEANLAEVGSSKDESYMILSGTSMAVSLTAGAAALVREWLIKYQQVANPSSALVKAMLLNGAVNPAPGQYGTGDTQEIPTTRPNNVSGWGRVDLVETIMPATPRQLWFEEHVGIQTRQKVRYKILVGSGSESTPQPLHITLAWTDYPGQPSASKALVNDIDLAVVDSQRALYHGNSDVYAEGDSCEVQRYDSCNTVESVFLQSAPPGVYSIVVTGVDIPAGEEPEGWQPFALVVSGDNVRPIEKVFLPHVMRGGEAE